jgi:hypothetical protein
VSNEPIDKKRPRKTYQEEKDARIDRALRARNRAKYDSSLTAAQYRYATSESRSRCLKECLLKLELDIPEDRQAQFLLAVKFALAELAAGRRKPDISKNDELSLLLRLKDASMAFAITLNESYKYHRLSDSINEILKVLLFEFAKHHIPTMGNLGRPQQRVRDLYFAIDDDVSSGVPARFHDKLTIFLVEKIKTLESTMRLDYHEYKFVRQLAFAWQQAIGRLPSQSRNRDHTKTGVAGGDYYSVKFELFLNAIVTDPKIGPDVIRSELEALKLAAEKAPASTSAS